MIRYRRRSDKIWDVIEDLGGVNLEIVPGSPELLKEYRIEIELLKDSHDRLHAKFLEVVRSELEFKRTRSVYDKCIIRPCSYDEYHWALNETNRAFHVWYFDAWPRYKETYDSCL